MMRGRGTENSLLCPLGQSERSWIGFVGPAWTLLPNALEILEWQISLAWMPYVKHLTPTNSKIGVTSKSSVAIMHMIDFCVTQGIRNTRSNSAVDIRPTPEWKMTLPTPRPQWMSQWHQSDRWDGSVHPAPGPANPARSPSGWITCWLSVSDLSTFVTSFHP